VRDYNGNPIVGRAVSFVAQPGSAMPAGPLPGSPVLTNAAGNAVLTYTSPNTGIDYIVATEQSATHGAISSNTAEKVWYNGVDMGDLTPCGYPTLTNNPGHVLSGIAWLGPRVDGEAVPHAFPANTDLIHNSLLQSHLDNWEDGVAFFGAPWTPCTMVSVIVQVSSGPNYASYVQHGGHLYLNAWKDGNGDYSFDDVLCGGQAPEWIIEDAIVTPGLHVFNFMDPGTNNLGNYNGILRFRLTHQPVGPFGYGLMDVQSCPTMVNGTFGLDQVLGEDEDYVICDLQLSVELTSFDAQPGDNAVALRWTTSSEIQNNHFDLMRDGVAIAHIPTQGNGAVAHNYTYTDESAHNGTLYHYSLVAVDVNGGRVDLRTTTSMPNASAAPVSAYALNQNYPNPFNPSTTISFDLLDNGFASLKVYNLMGQEVAGLVSRNLTAGRHTINFDATNLPSGVYIYRLNVNGFVAEKKMLLMK